MFVAVFASFVHYLKHGVVHRVWRFRESGQREERVRSMSYVKLTLFTYTHTPFTVTDIHSKHHTCFYG